MSSKCHKKKKKKFLDPRLVAAYSVEMVPSVAQPSETTISPDEKDLIKLYKTFATTVWRMRGVLIDTETNEPKEELSERNIAKLAKYLESLDGALEDAHVQIKGDYTGKPYDEGDAVKVITFEDRHDLTRDEYIETLTPTVRWTDKDGKPRLLQQAEVVVGKATQN